MNSNQNSKQEYYVNEIKKKLNENRKSIVHKWNNPVGTKTRYFYLDELLPQKDVEEIYNAFPRNGEGFFNKESFREKKKSSANLLFTLLPLTIALLL